jgi:hypothetical protein
LTDDDAFDVEPVLRTAGEHLEDYEVLGAAGDDRFAAADRIVARSLDRPLLERHRGQSDVDRWVSRGSPQRPTATPPMTRKGQARSRQNRWISSAAEKIGFTDREAV